MVSKKKLKGLLSKIHLPNWLTILLIIVLILRIPSFFEPYSYGDEMIYLSLGNAIRKGVPLYKAIHDNKPPLLYITAAIAGNLFWFKVILAFWSLATITFFHKLARTLFPKKNRLQKFSTIIFALLTTLPLLEGNIVNAELFMLGPIIAAFFILLTKRLDFRNTFFAGLLFSIATLFKVPAAFDVLTIVFIWLVVSGIKVKKLKKVAINTGYLALGFLTPIALTLAWYFLRGALKEYVVAAFLQNLGYLSTWRPADVQRPFLIRNAPLLIRAGLVGLGLTTLYWRRKKLSKQFIFLTAWLLFSLFAVTLSERPYPHYLIQAVPAVSFLLAMLVTQRTIEQSLVIIPLTLAFFVPVYFKFWYYPTTSYYIRFVKLATRQMTRDEYFSTFDGNVVRNYKIADYIVRSCEDGNSLFVWGDTSVIYALTRRLPPLKYVADYHIRDFSTKEATLLALRTNKPEFIVIQPGGPEFNELSFLLNESYVPVTTIDGAEIWKLISPTALGVIAP
jgi:hypothetical protein